MNEDAQTISIWQLPKIAWACAILFTINVLIAACIKISPELQVDIYGRASGDVVLAHAKPSAFVEPEKVRPVRQAMKLKPIVELLPEVAATMNVELANIPAAPGFHSSAGQHESRQMAVPVVVPAVYRQPAYASGTRAMEAVEKQMKFPRMSAWLAPASTAPPTLNREDVTPSKATQAEARSTVVN